MVGAQRRSDCAARVSCCGLEPDAVEYALAQKLSISDTVERHAPRETQIALTGRRGGTACEIHHDLLGHRLNAGCEVHLALSEHAFGCPRISSKQPMKCVVRHCEAGAIVEIPHVEPEA